MPIIYILSPGLTELTKSPCRTTLTDWGSKPGGADYGSYWTTICCMFLNELSPYSNSNGLSLSS
jgi:hypothetical protein